MTDHLFLHPQIRGTRVAGRFLAFADDDVSLIAVNNRISNNLALLASTVSMRAARLARRNETMDAREVAATLHEITARIAVVGHLHRLLATQSGADHGEFGPHLRELCRLFISTLAPERFELLETEIDDCRVSADHFLPLSLIVTEVVTNALKYAHPAGAPGRLTIGCAHEPGGALAVEVEDDGVGFPEGFDFATCGGTGARIIEMLAEQIDAEISFDSRPTGLRFALRLPAADRPG
jgi:two-component sensor histidine kinase